MAESLFALHQSGAVERKGLRDRVYELILDMLMSSKLEAGMRLPIDGIARDLNVSPTPVREALVQLERTGLVTREPLKGYRVAPPITGQQLEALYDTRLLLEGGAAELAAKEYLQLVPILERAVHKQEKAARTVLSAQDKGQLTLPALRTYYASDWNFHHQIFLGSGNPFLLDMSEAISSRVHRMRQSVIHGIHDTDDAVSEHREVLDAFRTGDPQQAAAAMRAHIEQVRMRSRAEADGDDQIEA